MPTRVRGVRACAVGARVRDCPARPDVGAGNVIRVATVHNNMSIPLSPILFAHLVIDSARPYSTT